MSAVALNAYKGSASLTQNTNNSSPLSLPSLESLNGGQIQSSVGNENSNIGGLIGNNNGSLSILDGGAIKEAFEFANRSVMAVADLTTKFIQTNSAVNAGALGIANKAQDQLTAKEIETDNPLQNKNLLIVVAVVAVAFLYFRK